MAGCAIEIEIQRTFKIHFAIADILINRQVVAILKPVDPVFPILPHRANRADPLGFESRPERAMNDFAGLPDPESRRQGIVKHGSPDRRLHCLLHAISPFAKKWFARCLSLPRRTLVRFRPASGRQLPKLF